MTPTKLTALMVVSVWMGGVKAGGGEASCSLSNIAKMEKFMPAKMEGTWYLTHRSHTPSNVHGIGLFTDWHEQKHRVPFNFTQVSKDGLCSVVSAEFVEDPNNPAKWTAVISNSVVLNSYFLGTDYVTTAAAYDEVVINGVVNRDLSVIDIGVRDPHQLPNMQVLSRGLEMFCGKNATSLDYFDYFPPSSTPTCNL